MWSWTDIDFFLKSCFIFMYCFYKKSLCCVVVIVIKPRVNALPCSQAELSKYCKNNLHHRTVQQVNKSAKQSKSKTVYHNAFPTLNSFGKCTISIAKTMKCIVCIRTINCAHRVFIFVNVLTIKCRHTIFRI